MILSKKLLVTAVTALTVASMFTGVSGASAATVRPAGVTVQTGNLPTAPKEPNCKTFVGLWNTDCTARDRWRVARSQAVTTANVERLMISTYTPIFSAKPGKKQTAWQINIQNAFIASYQRLENNPTTRNLNQYKNLAMYQLALNATQDNALNTFKQYNSIADATGDLGKKVTAKAVVSKMFDYAAKHIGLKVSVDWVAVTSLAMSTVRSSGICNELTMVAN